MAVKAGTIMAAWKNLSSVIVLQSAILGHLLVTHAAHERMMVHML
jgi:hypothetical protein